MLYNDVSDYQRGVRLSTEKVSTSRPSCDHNTTSLEQRVLANESNLGSVTEFLLAELDISYTGHAIINVVVPNTAIDGRSALLLLLSVFERFLVPKCPEGITHRDHSLVVSIPLKIRNSFCNACQIQNNECRGKKKYILEDVFAVAALSTVQPNCSQNRSGEEFCICRVQLDS